MVETFMPPEGEVVVTGKTDCTVCSGTGVLPTKGSNAEAFIRMACPLCSQASEDS